MLKDDVATQVGHSDTKEIERTYGHLWKQDESYERVGAGLDASFGAKPGFGSIGNGRLRAATLWPTTGTW